MRSALSLIITSVVIVAASPSEAQACSCYGAPWLQWPEAELPADHAMAFGSCWGTSFLENLRVSVDGAPAELVVDGPTSGARYLGLRVEPPPAEGQTILLEACDVDCGDPGDWTEQATLTVVAPLGPPAPEPIVDGALSHASGSWEPECGIVEFRVDLQFEVTPASNVMYEVEVGLEGQEPIYTNYHRVLGHGDMTARSVTEYFVSADELGVPPEDLCATVTVFDFVGGASEPVQICGSVEDVGGGSGSEGGSGDGGSDGGLDSGGGSGSADSAGSGSSTAGEDDDAAGCGCQARGDDPGWLFALAPLLLGLRRRRT